MPEEFYTKIDNHAEIAKGRQVYQYKGKENWEKLLTVHVGRLQNIEDVLHDMLTRRNLTNGAGVLLDLEGADLLLTRNPGESDADFLARIQVEINLLKGFGQTPVLISNLTRLIQPLTHSLKQIFPLKILMWIFVDDFGDLTPEEIARIDLVMQDVKAAGVGLEIGLQLIGNAFIVSDNPAGGPAGQGAATLPDGSDGGAFVKSLI